MYICIHTHTYRDIYIRTRNTIQMTYICTQNTICRVYILYILVYCVYMYIYVCNIFICVYINIFLISIYIYIPHIFSVCVWNGRELWHTCYTCTHICLCVSRQCFGRRIYMDPWRIRICMCMFIDQEREICIHGLYVYVEGVIHGYMSHVYVARM